MNSRAHRAAFHLATLLLVACASQRPAPVAEFDSLQQRLAGLKAWQVEGKIGLRQQGKGNSALLNWRQRDGHYSLRLSGPLGIGTVFIEGDANGVSVRNKHGLFEAATPEQLLFEQTGWYIPVSQLQFWARGLPARDLPIDTQRVESGRLAELSQGGWDIEYRDYQQVADLWLPGRLVMTRPETTLTLLLKRWRLEDKP